MTEEMEDVESFRQRARAFVREHLHKADIVMSLRHRPDEEELAAVARDREIQRLMFDAGLAGVCVPKEYGGQALTPAHQRALNEELEGYEFPAHLQVPTMTPCLSVLLEFGTEEQKLEHVPAILKGEEIWMQFLSEPSGGSDVAGALTTAVRDGDEWVLNGSKVWTTGAWWSDWCLCLARTNWDVQKHRGLSVFIFPLYQDGIEVHRIEMLNGNREFCQEFISDLRVPDSDRIGEVDQGWTVATRWMFHERMMHNSPLVTAPPGGMRGGGRNAALIEVARAAGRIDDPKARELVGEARMLDLVGEELQDRLAVGIRTGTLPDQSSAMGRLYHGTAGVRRFTIAFEIANELGVTWTDDDGDETLRNAGTLFLMRQSACIGGGTTEMARNVISERVLGMPREMTKDKDVPFRDVPRSPSGSSR